MNTTTAARTAAVTIRTIQHWCRYGAVAAVKSSGRWNIDEASLAYRISLGKKSIVDEYEITESTDRYDRPIYTVTRTDGTTDSRLYAATYRDHARAEVHCEFLNRTPRGYSLSIEQYSGRQFGRSSDYYWKVSGGLTEDPSTLKSTLDLGADANWATGQRLVDHFVRTVLDHVDGAQKRITAKAERDAVEAAESAVREARTAQLDELRRTKGELATPRQVDYILQLLVGRERSGEGGGFYYGPTGRAGIEEMTKGEASLFITSLKGDY